MGDSQGESLRCELLNAQLTTELLDCGRPELDELRGAEDCEVMADSILLPEPEEKCWADGLRWVRDETLEADCICERVCARAYMWQVGRFSFLLRVNWMAGKRERDTADAGSKEPVS